MNAMFTPVNRNLTEHNYRTFDEKHLYPVVAPQRLLLAPIRGGIIHELKKILTNLPDEYFDVLYRDLIDEFTSFVQILPVTNESKLASLLDESLMRAFFAVQIYQKDKPEVQDYLMPYVVFSSNLLMDISCVLRDRSVILSEEDGTFISMWNPYNDGAMTVGSYYRIRAGGGLSPWSAKRSTVCLACKIMPNVGFDWIYKNSHIFDMWLALLADDKEGAGLLRLYFDRANDMVNDLKNNPEFVVPTTIETLESIALNNANDFLDWLQNQLALDNVAIDKQYGEIYNIEGDNLLITKALLNRYIAKGRKQSLGMDADTLLQDLEKVGFIKGEEKEYVYENTGNNNKYKEFSGFLHTTVDNDGMANAEKSNSDQAKTGLDNLQKDEKTIASNETKIERVMASGGIIHGYVVNVAHGLILPPTSNPVQVASVDKAVARDNQLPQLPEQQNSNNNANKNIENNPQQKVGSMFGS